MTVTITPIGVGTVEGDGTGDKARTAGQSINTNQANIKAAIEDLEGRFWTLDDTARSLALGERVVSETHAGITHTLPATFALSATALSDIWVWNADTNSNVTLAPNTGDEIFINGTGQGASTSITIAFGELAIISPRVTDTSWDVIILVTKANLATAAQGALADSALQSIAADSITMDMLVDIATDTFLGRVTAATGTVEVLTNAQAKTALDLTGTNSGDQTSMSGISDTKANFDIACSDGDFMYIGDAPTSHTHLLAAGATDVTATAAELNVLDLSGTALTTGWVYAADGVSTASWRKLLGSEITNDQSWAADQTTMSGFSDTKANFNTACSDGTFMYVGDAPTSHTLLSHTISGETQGHVLAADSATTYSIRQLLGSEISNTENWAADQTLTDLGVNATAGELNILDLSATALTAGWGYFADGASTASWRKLLGSEITNDQSWAADQTTMSGFSDTKANFNTACSDGTFLYVGDVTSNVTHTGQVTGATALSLDVTAITAQPASGAIIATDTILTNDGGVLSETTFTQLNTYFNSSLSFSTASSSDTFTNKTFDANGTGNSLSNVDVADLANGTDGELITWDAAGAPATVGAGTTDQVLTSNGAGAAPTFQSLSAVRWSKSITVENPDDAEDISIFFTNVALTITEMRAVVRGTTPSVTWTIKHHATDRSNAGNAVVTAGTTTTSQTSGSDVTSFNDATIPADSFVWFETSAQTGTVDEINVTMIGTED
jgi:hypothetical protein